MHVYDFITNPTDYVNETNKELSEKDKILNIRHLEYAKLFFTLFAQPATLHFNIGRGIDKFFNKNTNSLEKLIPLYCTYENNRYRVTGCSRLGDVWLKNLSIKSSSHHDLRVDIDKVYFFSPNEVEQK